MMLGSFLLKYEYILYKKVPGPYELRYLLMYTQTSI